MKKKYQLLFFIIICLTTGSYAQENREPENHSLHRSVYKDAADIVSDSTKRDKILFFYFKDNAEIDKFNSDYDFATKLKHFTNSPTKTDIENRDKTIAATIQANLGGAGVLSNPTAGIDALGSFIANRFKQEINIAFLTKFKKELENKPYLGLLFPESKNVLITSDPYNYPVFINALQEAFQVDSKNLFINLPAALEKLNGSVPEILLVAKLLNHNTPENIISVINGIADGYKGDNEKLKEALYVTAFSLNAMNKGGTGAGMFLTRTDLGSFTNNNFANTYFALLTRQNEKYVKGLSIKADVISKTQDLLNGLIVTYETISEQADLLRSQNEEDSLTVGMVINASNIVLKSVKKTMAVYKDKFDKDFDMSGFDKVLEYSNKSVQITDLIEKKKYGLAFVELVQVIGYAYQEKNPEEFARFKKYSGFIANVLAAEDKEDIMTALETSANPVGSYRVKRNSTFNISLNAYAGGFYGVSKKEKPLYGFTAPVGIYLGWGNIGNIDIKNDKGQSFGFFIPLIDVGAVTAFRLQDENTEMADVSWSNVFAPGLYATYGFRKCPVSINAGGQFGPELNKINSDGTTVLTQKDWYWRVGVVVDIPFFDLYIKQKAYEPTKVERKLEKEQEKKEREAIKEAKKAAKEQEKKEREAAKETKNAAKEQKEEVKVD